MRFIQAFSEKKIPVPRGGGSSAVPQNGGGGGACASRGGREILEVDILWPRWVAARIGVTRSTLFWTKTQNLSLFWCFLTADRHDHTQRVASDGPGYLASSQFPGWTVCPWGGGIRAPEREG